MSEGLFDISGKVALVTGGSRGIGLMIARSFVEAGVRTYVSSRKAEVCDEVAAELAKVGECHSLPADCATEAGCRALAAAFAEREPALHILVNNAGATWGAPHRGARRGVVGPGARPQREGRVPPHQVPAAAAASRGGTADDPARVINIGSIDGIQVPMLETYSYSSSKAAVHQLTRHLAPQAGAGDHRQRHGARAVRVEDDGGDARRPSATRSPASAPLKRIGRPDDMAGSAIFLASRAGAYVTGAVIPVDGGIATTK